MDYARAPVVKKNFEGKWHWIADANVIALGLMYLIALLVIPTWSISEDTVDFPAMTACALGAALWTRHDFRLGLKPTETDNNPPFSFAADAT